MALALSDFELLKTLGEGSVSHVVQARHRATGKEYAIKVIDKHFVLRNRLTGSVRLERKLLDTLSDPGIVRLEFTFQDEASLYLGLQCCPDGAQSSTGQCSRRAHEQASSCSAQGSCSIR